MNLKKTLTGLFAIACLSAGAQDIHFSQYFASPLTLNPALTGGFNGKLRLAANYRNQWFSFLKSASFVTYSGSFDMPILKKKLRHDRLGVGLMVFNDRAGSGGLTNLTVMVGAAYHKVLDEQARYSLALGVHAGITQKRIDFSKLTFEEQYVADLDFDPTAYNGERIIKTSFIYPDFTIGLLFRGRFSKKVTGYLGGSMFHLHKPKEYFLEQDGKENRLDARFLAHGGADIKITKAFSVTPGFLYMLQNTASEITAGLAFGYSFNEDNTLFLGAWFRAFDKDAVIPMLAYELYGLRVGISYDINLSDLKLASNSQGAVELSLIYILGKEPERELSPTNFCPKF